MCHDPGPDRAAHDENSNHCSLMYEYRTRDVSIPAPAWKCCREEFSSDKVQLQPGTAQTAKQRWYYAMSDKQRAIWL